MPLTKEDQKLIEEEEELYRQTIEILLDQLPEVRSKKIFSNLAARELTSQVVNEWNFEERQPLISDEAAIDILSSV